MVLLSILILIVVKALPFLNLKISPIIFTRISAIIFIYVGVLSFNTLYLQSIGSGIGIYSGLFHVTTISQFIEVFILIIGSLILISWPLIPKLYYNLGSFSSLIILKNDYDSKWEKENKLFPNKNNNLITVSNVNNVKTLDLFTKNNSSEYCLIVLFSTLGASLLISSSDLISMYLSIELQSFGLYILSTLHKDSESSTNAGLKYFLLGGLSSCLILLGSGIIYAYTGLTNFESIYSIISVSDFNYIIQALCLGLILIIVGFLFKISAAPLHNWSPDVYDDTPTIVTIWLTIMPKISILILLIEIYTQIDFISNLNSLNISTDGYIEYLNLNNIITSELEKNKLIITSPITLGSEIYIEHFINILKNLLLISSLLSLILGSIVGLCQVRIKRLLAYSTISHIGFILLALSIKTEQSIDSLLFYIIQYSITNLNIFLIILALSYIININNTNNNNELKINDIKYITELKHQFFSNPLISLSLSICLFSLAGIPPLIGFFSKQFVLYSALQSGYYFITIVAILASVVSASYYLKIVNILHSEKENKENIIELKYFINNNNSSLKKELKTIKYKVENYKNNILTNFHSFLISNLTLLILFFFIKPSLILNSTQVLSLSLFKL